MKKPDPAAAIVTGLGVLGFGALYFLTGIFPSRTLASPDRVVTQAEEPARFGFAILVTFVAGAVCLIWGILKSKKS